MCFVRSPVHCVIFWKVEFVLISIILKSSKGPEGSRFLGGHGSPEAQTVQEGRLHEFNKFYLIPFLDDKALLAQQEGQPTKINLFSFVPL